MVPHGFRKNFLFLSCDDSQVLSTHTQTTSLSLSAWVQVCQNAQLWQWTGTLTEDRYSEPTVQLHSDRGQVPQTAQCIFHSETWRFWVHPQILNDIFLNINMKQKGAKIKVFQKKDIELRTKDMTSFMVCNLMQCISTIYVIWMKSESSCQPVLVHLRRWCLLFICSTWYQPSVSILKDSPSILKQIQATLGCWQVCCCHEDWV